MTRVIPPRESMPSEAAILRRSKPSFFRWSVLRSATLRVSGLLLLVQAALAWLIIFGADNIDFLDRIMREQILIAALAIVATIGGVGLWMLALWGVAFWVICLGLDIVPLVMRVPLHELPHELWKNPFLVGSLALFVLFILAALLSAVEAGRQERD
jgi:hypothetical protein